MTYKTLLQAYGAYGNTTSYSPPGPTIVSSIFIYCNSSSGSYTTAAPAIKIKSYGPSSERILWSGALATGETVQISGGISLAQYEDIGIYVDENYNGDTYSVTIFGAENV